MRCTARRLTPTALATMRPVQCVACRGGLPHGSARILATVAAGSGFFARLARLIAQQPVDTLLGEALLPSPYRRTADGSLARHRQHRQAVARQENDPSPLNVFLRPVSITGDRGQSQAILIAKKDTDGLCHAPRFAWFEAAVNPMFASMH